MALQHDRDEFAILTGQHIESPFLLQELAKSNARIPGCALRFAACFICRCFFNCCACFNIASNSLCSGNFTSTLYKIDQSELQATDMCLPFRSGFELQNIKWFFQIHSSIPAIVTPRSCIASNKARIEFLELLD